ncbi:N-acetyltransferase 8-like [Amblyraja radiata]|uniref:N-acetyltransferase 8-like n=1 Tax=Amblyraja radiata TaxID=386614 RepID=UPI0014040800|nr:N-acetyltransferase 8-like [Amblyraja radiata]
MQPFSIRCYGDCDGQRVRELYTAGVWEHFPRARRHLLGQWWVWVAVGLVLGLLLALPLPPVLALGLGAVLLATVHQLLRHVWSSLINQNLRADLLDPASHYLGREGGCFWVAECQGQVVGTVGVVPSNASPAELELKRLNVAITHRRRGIAKALCRTVLAFAHTSGFTAVVLSTSLIQTEAQHLYLKMGFQPTSTVLPPNLLAKLTNYTIHRYRLTLAGEFRSLDPKYPLGINAVKQSSGGSQPDPDPDPAPGAAAAPATPKWGWQRHREQQQQQQQHREQRQWHRTGSELSKEQGAELSRERAPGVS